MNQGMKRIRGVVFDYGNTLVCVDPSLGSLRTDYADVVARPGAERMAFLRDACGEDGELRQEVESLLSHVGGEVGKLR